MLSELIPVLATTVGTAVAATYVERVRNRHRQADRSDEREVERRRALRLVEQELYEAAAWIERAARVGRYHPPRRRGATAEWDQHRAILAVELGVADWHRACAAYDAISDLNEVLAERLDTALGSSPDNIAQAVTGALIEVKLTEVSDSDRLELRWRAIRSASWILRAYLDEAGNAAHAIDEDNRLAAEIWAPEASSATL